MRFEPYMSPGGERGRGGGSGGSQRQKILNFWEIAKFGGKQQNFNDFSQNFELFSIFLKTFDQILKLILMTPVIITNLQKKYFEIFYLFTFLSCD
jgi:hypothetical protein